MIKASKKPSISHNEEESVPAHLIGSGNSKKISIHPTAEEIMSMTPAQKQDFLARRKMIQKKETEEYESRRDP